MSMPEETRYERDNDDLNQLLRELRKLARRFWAFARSRRAECWLFFAAGLVLGMFVG